MINIKVTNCYCGSSLSFSECCQPKHLGTQYAKTPEELMRSRYSAFCNADVKYLIQTLLPSKRQASDADDIQQTISATQWQRLQVIQHSHNKHVGTVEFVAFFTSHEQPDQLHEKSTFTQQEGLWYYVDGEQLPPIKLQRNDPCFCGSGKKLKKCCVY